MTTTLLSLDQALLIAKGTLEAGRAAGYAPLCVADTGAESPPQR
jgi:hypothetical protein